MMEWHQSGDLKSKLGHELHHRTKEKRNDTMFNEKINVMFEGCMQEVLNSKNKVIKKAVSTIKKSLSEEDFTHFLFTVIQGFLLNLFQNSFTSEDLEESFEEYITRSVEELKVLKKGIVLDVCVEGLEKELSRVIQIPYVCSLADLAYAVLVAFQAEGAHLFDVIYKKESYACSASEDVEHFASDTMITQLKVRKGSKMEVWYDFGDNYTFNITIKDIITMDTLPQEESFSVLEGVGYGIWEDAHYELGMFYRDNKAFKDFLEHENLEEDYYPVHEKFDLIDTNEMLFPYMQRMKMSYEYPDEYQKLLNEVLA